MARRKRLMALVLADSAGLVVASSYKGPEAEELAAMAPMLARSGEPDAPLDGMPEVPLSIHPLRIDRTSLYLCAVGDRQRSQSGLRVAAGGIQRILTTH